MPSAGGRTAPFRVQAELRFTDDLRVGRKRIARLMRATGLEGVHRRRFVRTTVRDATAVPAPDLVQRSFTAPGPSLIEVGCPWGTSAHARRHSPEQMGIDGHLHSAHLPEVE